MANIGKNIKMFRLRNNMTQEAFAEKLFVSRQTVSNYENNKSNPDIEMLINIAEIFDTDVNTLIYGEPEMILKKKRIVKAVLWVIGMFFLSIVVFYLKEEYVRKYMMSNMDVTVSYLYYAIAEPIFWIVVGWGVMEVLCTALQIQPIKKTISKWIFWSTLIVLIIYIILMLPTCIGMIVDQIQYMRAYHQWELSRDSVFSWNHTIEFIPWWDSLAMGVLFCIISKRMAILFILPGLLLRIAHEK